MPKGSKPVVETKAPAKLQKPEEKAEEKPVEAVKKAEKPIEPVKEAAKTVVPVKESEKAVEPAKEEKPAEDAQVTEEKRSEEVDKDAKTDN